MFVYSANDVMPYRTCLLTL